MSELAVCLLGPTGCGKTEAALLLADQLGGAIVNFDSRQVYAGLGLITAQPNPDELARAEHHLYGFLPPNKTLGAGKYARRALPVLDKLKEQARAAILVGGTGLYLDALLKGLSPIPQVDPQVRRMVEESWRELGPQALYAKLREIDPAYAAKIHPNDYQRLTRALEVPQATGQTLTQWHARPGQGYHWSKGRIKIGLKLGLDEIAPRLARRIDIMLELGALEEMKAALDNFPEPEVKAFSGIGCAELLAHLRGELTLDAAKALWLQRTRDYAKRQLTWFVRDKEIAWFKPGDLAGVSRTVREFAGRVE